MIDLHCHLLPGIDDGPKSIDESLAMARYAANAGIAKIVTTPHITPGRYDNSLASIQPVFEKLKAAIKQQAIPIEISFAAEIRFDPVIIDMVNNDILPVLGEYEGERIILLEFPHTHIPPGCEDLIRWLADKGVRVLIAHPERNPSVMGNIEIITSFIKMGCLLQITGGALTGVFKEGPRQCAVELLKRGWVSIIASDAHNIHARCPELEPARQEAAKIVGEEEASDMVISRPADIAKMHFDSSQA
jgi:protein-tyrosine phosphatase